MKTIIASKKLMDLAVSGLRRQTVRVWRRKHSIKPGEIVTLFNYREKLPIRVVSKKEKKIDELNMDEALLNGYINLEEFKKAILTIYNQATQLTVIRFEVLT